jgi:hypothetical protein
MISAAAASMLIVLHAAGGREVTINPRQVTSMQAKVGEKNKLLTDDVNCVVGLTDGKFVSVVEPCAVVRRMLEESLK